MLEAETIKESENIAEKDGFFVRSGKIKESESIAEKDHNEDKGPGLAG